MKPVFPDCIGNIPPLDRTGHSGIYRACHRVLSHGSEAGVGYEEVWPGKHAYIAIFYPQGQVQVDACPITVMALNCRIAKRKSGSQEEYLYF